MKISKKEYDEIAREISSDESVVGIDAKKTHILILSMLNKLGRQVERLDERLSAIEKEIVEK